MVCVQERGRGHDQDAPWRSSRGPCLFRFEGSHDWQDALSKVFNVFEIVEKSAQHEVDTRRFVFDDSGGHLLRRPDEAWTETVVVLNEILERRVGPVALTLWRSLSGLLDGVAKGVHRLG